MCLIMRHLPWLSGWRLVLVVSLIYPVTTIGSWFLDPGARDIDASSYVAERWWSIGIIAGLVWIVVWLSHSRVNLSNRVPARAVVLAWPIALLGVAWALGINPDPRFVLFSLAGCIFVGIAEETAFRGLILNTLVPKLGVAWAVALSALIFGVTHLLNVIIFDQGMTEVLAQVAITSVIGMLFGWIYVFTGGNLWLVIALHAAYDFFLFTAVVPNDGTTATAWLIAAVPFLMVAMSILATIIGIRRYRGRFEFSLN